MKLRTIVWIMITLGAFVGYILGWVVGTAQLDYAVNMIAVLVCACIGGIGAGILETMES